MHSFRVFWRKNIFAEVSFKGKLALPLTANSVRCLRKQCNHDSGGNSGSDDAGDVGSHGMHQ
jgi:hypothetical protein